MRAPNFGGGADPLPERRRHASKRTLSVPRVEVSGAAKGRETSVKRTKRAASTSRGFTLVELMIVVAITGVLAALSVFGVTRYVAHSKTAEARNVISAIAKAAAAVQARGRMSSDLVPLGESSGEEVNEYCYNSSTVPRSFASVRGVKYQSRPRDWDSAWECLRFDMEQPQYYQYKFEVLYFPNSGFRARARGDLDGDGKDSNFVYEGHSMGNGMTKMAPAIFEDEPEE